MDILTNILVSAITIIVWSLWDAHKHILGRNFLWGKFIEQNKNRWGLVLVICSLVAVLFYIDPKIIDAMGDMVSIKASPGPPVFVFLTIALMGLTKKKS